MENISGAMHLHTSVTDLQVAELPGDLTLDSDDLHVNEAKGQVRVVTHSKDIDLSQIYGDSYVEDRDGRISVEPAGNYAVEAKNSKGDVEVTLAPNASATIERAHPQRRDHDGVWLAVTGDESKTANGQIGSGAAKITLSTDVGDISIKKGAAYPSTPPTPATPTECAALSQDAGACQSAQAEDLEGAARAAGDAVSFVRNVS